MILAFKKILAAATALGFIFGAGGFLGNLNEDVFTLRASAYGEEDPTSGKIGENITWKLSADGTLTISGCGEMDIEFCESPFMDRRDIKKVVIENGITSIGYHAFFNCKELTEVTIPDSVEYIHMWSFAHCGNLRSVKIPEGVTDFDACVFFNCYQLSDIEIPKSLISIGAGSFDNTQWLENKQRESPFVIVNDMLINGYDCKGDVVLPAGIKSISYGAFEGCEDISSVEISDGVEKIWGVAFTDCKNLTEVRIPQSVTSIDEMAFTGCPKLTSVTIPSSVAKIGEQAFGYDKYGKKITDVTISGYKGSAAEKYARENGFKFIDLKTGKVSVFLGDVNGDGTIDIEDAVAVIGHVNGNKALTAEENERADVDANKTVDIEDAVAIIGHVNGLKVIG